jgi:tripartite-type tricarboxylate transporter receptor subunit TctC
MIVNKAEQQSGASIVVENRPGAGGTIGTTQIKQAPADGYTLMQGSHSTHSTNPFIYKKIAYDPISDFDPITLLFVSRTFLLAPSSLGVSTVAELVALAKKKPGGLTYASPGVGSGGHIGGAMLGRAIGVPMTHVPYKGSAGTRADVIAGRVDFIFNSVHPFVGDVAAGNVKVLALAHSERFPGMANVPTMAEVGFPGLEVHNWFGLFAPRGVPPEILDTLNGMFVKAANAPDVRDSALKQGFLMNTMSRKEFAEFLRDQIDRMSKVVKDLNISI